MNSVDSEPLKLRSRKSKLHTTDKITNDDFSDVIFGMHKKFSWKVAFLLFIFYVLLNSDIFIQNILGGMSKSFVVNGSEPSSNAIIVQGILITLAYIILSLIQDVI